MNIKEFLLPVALALLVVAVFNYFLPSREPARGAQEDVSGKMYEVKREPELAVPLNWKITLPDREKQQVQPVAVKTSYGELAFDPLTATLDRFVLTYAGKTTTILDEQLTQHTMFLLAGADAVSGYLFKGQRDTEQAVLVEFECVQPEVAITKIFAVYKQFPRIDLTISVRAVVNQITTSNKLRLFYVAPHVDSGKNGQFMAFVNERTGLKIYRNPDEVDLRTWHSLTIFGAADKCFVFAMIKDSNAFIHRAAFNRITEGKNDLVVQLESNEIAKSGTWTLSFYVGPKQLSLLSAVDNRLEEVLDYGFLSPISKAMLKILNFFYGYIKNYGLAIILFTLLLQLLLLPLSLRGQQSMEKNAELQRKIQYLKQKYHNDPERFRVEQAELIKTHGVGGLFGGCVLFLVQIPVFFALNRLLSSCFELRSERFLWIPDLEAHDPWYILPILMALTILLRSYDAKKPFNKQLPMYALALFLGAMMSGVSAGLVLFFLTAAVVNVAQNYLTKFIRK